MRSRDKPDWQKKIAQERIDILFDLAKKELRKHPERSKRYVQLARKIGLRYNIRFSKEEKRKFCKSCNTLLVPGYTSEVRLDKKTHAMSIKCLECNTIYRYPYK
ncbi:ribonuclease P [archaeon]|nr:MAG: ribonuclease P [archaeon]